METGKWIDINEKLPDPHQSVLLRMRHGGETVVGFLHMGETLRWTAPKPYPARIGGADGCYEGGFEFSRVSHWCPCPSF
jgi:hypothetical protein